MTVVFGLVKTMKESGVIVSSFGIGQDFNEQIMTGIAEFGSGDYYFMKDSSSIEQVVAIGLKQMVSAFGTDAVLMIRGLNGAVVQKVLGYSSSEVLNGMKLGDLRRNDLRKIVIELSITPSNRLNDNDPNDKEVRVDYLSYDLSYLPLEQGERVLVQGVMSLPHTTERSEVHDNVAVETAFQLSSLNLRDQKVSELLAQGKQDEAIKEKSIILHELQEVADKAEASGSFSDAREAAIRAKRAKRVLADLLSASVPATLKSKVQYFANHVDRSYRSSDDEL